MSLSGRKTHLDRYRYTRKEPLILVENLSLDGSTQKDITRYLWSTIYINIAYLYYIGLQPHSLDQEEPSRPSRITLQVKHMIRISEINVSNYKSLKSLVYHFMSIFKISSNHNIKSNSRSINSAIEQFKNSQTNSKDILRAKFVFF